MFSINAQLEPQFILEGWEINGMTLEMKRGNETIKFRRKEFELLQFLLNHRNKVVNKHAILEYVWNYDLQAQSNTLEVHMANLRQKLHQKTSKKIIQTVYGAGYRLIA
jgi:two-component system OmpR family response regulator